MTKSRSGVSVSFGIYPFDWVWGTVFKHKVSRFYLGPIFIGFYRWS